MYIYIYNIQVHPYFVPTHEGGKHISHQRLYIYIHKFIYSPDVNYKFSKVEPTSYGKYYDRFLPFPVIVEL